MSKYQDIYEERSKRMIENRTVVITYIQRIRRADGTENEIDEMLKFIEDNVLDPSVSNLLFWDDRNLTAEEIYDIAMSYKPIIF